MSSKARGGLSKREWLAANPGQSLPSSSSSSGSSSRDYSVDTKALEKMQADLLTTMKPTGAETGAESQLRNILTSRDLGIEQVKQKPMASAFVTGQTAGIQRQTALQAQPLQNQLAALQSKRQSAMDALTTSLGFEQQRIQRGIVQQDLAEQARIQQEQFGQTMGFDRELLAEQARQFGISEGRLGKDSGYGTPGSFNPFANIGSQGSGAASYR